MAVQDVVEVDLGGHLVTVPKGGLYERFRMRTDLDEVERDPRVSSVDFFRKLPRNGLLRAARLARPSSGTGRTGASTRSSIPQSPRTNTALECAQRIERAKGGE